MRELRPAAARREDRRPGDRALLPDRAGAGQRGRHQASVRHAGDQPDRGCGARRPRSSSRRGSARYQPWLRDVRSFRPHQLDDEIERVLHEKSITGRNAWVRLFDETLAGLRFPLDGKELTSAEIFDLLSDKDRAQARGRRELDRGRAAAQHPPVRADHQHARQGQADRGRLATVPAADLEPQPRQPGRGRGRRCADRRGPRRLPAPVAPLLRDQGALARPRAARVLGSQRALARGRRPPGAPGRRPRSSCSTPTGASRRALAEIVERFFAGNWIDAALRPGQGLPAPSATRPCRACIPMC